ncbi:MAG: PHP domain-containing protein [Bacteroidales bacterium]|jgi:predicted metal-dependent phosphoesterase TrpH|nr:PHP domain-containing protein [Bacteroidales bacterium]
MHSFKSDLHIHTVLSPCADLDMSPTNIIDRAKQLGLQCIGITDHNSTLNAKVARKLGEKQDIFVLMGAEVTSKEEAHCLCFFEKEEELDSFQVWLDEKLPKIELDTNIFGYQLVVNEEEEILDEKPYLLISAIDADIEQIYEKVHSLNGLFIPAHINKPANSLISQLGFIPPDIKADAFEISNLSIKNEFIKKNAYLKNYQFLQDSDAHFLSALGSMYCNFVMEERTFEEFRLAIKGIDGRKVETIK